MLAYTIRRILALIPVLIGVAIIAWLLMELIPGDPSATLLPPETPGSVREAFRDQYHLNDPVYVRFPTWLWQVLQGDFGVSIASGQTARSIMLDALWNTAQLALAGTFLAVFFGVSIGLATAWWSNSAFDRGVSTLVVGGASMPAFWVGLVLIYIFAIKINLFPTGGIGPITGERDLATRFEYLVLPAITVAILPGAVITRLSRSLFLEVKQQEFVLALRTRGYSTLRIWRHILRNAAPGVVNICGLQAGYLILGTIFVEVVFSWPGIGYQISQSISYRDYPVIVAIILATGICFAMITMITDLLLRALDPRVEVD